MASRSLGTLTLDLVARIGGFTEGMDKAQRESSKRMKAIKADAEKLGKDIALALTAGAAAFTAIVKASINTADEMSKLAQSTGLTTEALSQLQYAAGLSGVDDLGNSLVKFNRNIAEAAQGTEAQAEAFKALGIDIKNADGSLRDAESLLIDVADAFSQYEDGAAKTAVAMELFGRSGAALIPLLNAGAEGIAEMRAEADAFGLTLDEATGKAAEAFNDNLSRMQEMVKGVALQSASELLPAMEGLSEVFVSTLKDTEAVSRAMDGLSFAFKSVVSTGIVVKNLFDLIGKTIGGVSAYVVTLFRDGLSAASEVSRSFHADVTSDFTDIFENIDAVWNNTVATVPEAAKVAAEETKKTLVLAGKDIADAVEKPAKKAKESLDLISEAAREQERIRERNLQAIRETIAALEAEVGALYAGADAQDARTLAVLRAQDATEEQVREVQNLLAALRSLNQLESFGIDFETLDFDDAVNLDSVFESLDDLEGAFDRIGGTASDAFASISDATKLFATASKLAGEEAFAAYTEGAAAALRGVQAFAEEGSGAYKSLGVAIEALHTITAVQAALNALATAPFPANFAAYAAALAAIASLGVSIGGGGGGPTGGALDGSNYGGQRGIGAGGTVLGDPGEASESIVNSIESLQNIAEKGLDVNRDMLQALKNIERLQAGVGAEFARFSASLSGAQSITLGGTLGDANAVRYGADGIDAFRDFLSDPANFLRRTIAGGTPIVNGLQQIFDELGAALGAAIGSFGGDAERAQEIFRSLELAGVTLREGDDIGEQLAELINSVGDAAFAVASRLVGIDISQFQRLGEGALETLTRLASQFTVLTDALDQFDISIRAKPQTLIAIADDLAARAGGVEQFADNIAGLFDVILTDEQQFERLREQLTSVFDGVGESLPLTREALGDLISGLDLTTEAGREAFTAISEANGLLGEFFDGLEQDAEELAAAAQASADFSSNLQRQIGALQAGDAELYALGLRFDDLRAQATGLGGGPLLELVNQLYALESGALAAARAAAEAARQMDLQIRLLAAQGDDAGALALTRQRELEQAANDVERALLQQIFAAEDAAAAQAAAAAAASIASRATRDYSSAVRDAGNAVADERKRLENELLQLVGATEELRRREREGISASNRALFDQIEALKDHREAVDEMAKAYGDIAGSIGSFRDSLIGAANDSVGASLETVRALFGDVARRARLGDLDALRSFASVGEQLRQASAAQASTQLEYLRDLALLRTEAGFAEQTALRQADLAEASFDELARQSLLLAGIHGELQQLRGVPVSQLSAAADIGSVHVVGQIPSTAMVSAASVSFEPEDRRVLVDMRRALNQLLANSEEGLQTGVPVRAFETSGLLVREAA